MWKCKKQHCFDIFTCAYHHAYMHARILQFHNDHVSLSSHSLWWETSATWTMRQLECFCRGPDPPIRQTVRRAVWPPGQAGARALSPRPQWNNTPTNSTNNSPNLKPSTRPTSSLAPNKITTVYPQRNSTSSSQITPQGNRRTPQGPNRIHLTPLVMPRKDLATPTIPEPKPDPVIPSQHLTHTMNTSRAHRLPKCHRQRQHLCRLATIRHRGQLSHPCRLR